MAAAHCIFLAGVRDADGVVHVCEHELEDLVHVDAGAVRKAKQAVVREGHRVAQRASMQHRLVGQARKRLRGSGKLA